MKRLALTKDEKFEYCDCIKNNGGDYICDHQNHQRCDETEDQFRKRINNRLEIENYLRECFQPYRDKYQDLYYFLMDKKEAKTRLNFDFKTNGAFIKGKYRLKDGTNIYVILINKFKLNLLCLALNYTNNYDIDDLKQYFKMILYHEIGHFLDHFNSDPEDIKQRELEQNELLEFFDDKNSDFFFDYFDKNKNYHTLPMESKANTLMGISSEFIDKNLTMVLDLIKTLKEILLK